jgi:hypothetical protein
MKKRPTFFAVWPGKKTACVGLLLCRLRIFYVDTAFSLQLALDEALFID